METVIEVWTMDTGLHEHSFVCRVTEEERVKLVLALEEKGKNGIRFRVFSNPVLKFEEALATVKRLM